MLGRERGLQSPAKAKPPTSGPLPLQTFQTCRQLLPGEGAISDQAVQGTEIPAKVYNWTRVVRPCPGLLSDFSLPPGARRCSCCSDPSPASCPHRPTATPKRDTPSPLPLLPGASRPSPGDRACPSPFAPPRPLRPPRPPEPLPSHRPPPSSPRPPPGPALRARGWGSHLPGRFAPGGTRAALFLGSSWAGCRCCIFFLPRRCLPFPYFSVSHKLSVLPSKCQDSPFLQYLFS